MHLIEEAISNFIKRFGLPDWSGIIILPLFVAIVIAIVYFIVAYIFWGINANKSKKLLKNGEKAFARYVAGRSEYKKVPKDDPDYKKEELYYVSYEYKTHKGQTVRIEEMTKNRRLSEKYNQEPSFEVYYMPNNPNYHKKLSEMGDIKKFENLPTTTLRIFLISFFSVLLIVVIGLFTDN